MGTWLCVLGDDFAELPGRTFCAAQRMVGKTSQLLNFEELESKIHNCDERFEPLLKNDASFFSQLLEVEEL